MALTFVSDFIKSLSEEKSGYEIAELLGVSSSMVSSYKHSNYNPSLEVAKRAYINFEVVLHPFSEESLSYDIERYSK